MSEPVRLNPSPAVRFRENPEFIKAHRNMVDSPEFQRGIDFATNEYSVMLSRAVADGNSAAAVGFKLQGVHDFIITLRNLSETPQAPNIVRPPSLNHKV